MKRACERLHYALFSELLSTVVGRLAHPIRIKDERIAVVNLNFSCQIFCLRQTTENWTALVQSVYPVLAFSDKHWRGMTRIHISQSTVLRIENAPEQRCESLARRPLAQHPIDSLARKF